jgi:hypothetical protein
LPPSAIVESCLHDMLRLGNKGHISFAMRKRRYEHA